MFTIDFVLLFLCSFRNLTRVEAYRNEHKTRIRKVRCQNVRMYIEEQVDKKSIVRNDEWNMSRIEMYRQTL